MKRFTTFACLLVACVFALGVNAGELPKFVDGHNSVIHGGNLEMSKSAARDTVYLIGPWGSGAIENGQFEDAAGAPNWNGWTSVDWTQKVDPIWHVDTYNVVAGSYSAWCGEIEYAACSELDAEGGYGSSYNELLVWRKQVDPNTTTTVTVTATVNHNTEPGYDYSNLGYYKADQSIQYLWTADGEGNLVPVSASVTYAPTEYVGDAGDEVAIAWHVTSDGGWDDSDCSYYGDGALQVDDVTVDVAGEVYFDDFEDGVDVPEQTEPTSIYMDWAVEFPVGVGDYAHIRSQMADEDPCNSNFSPLAVFIADDVMFAEGGNPTQLCQTWCYGPGGYIVNTLGGFAGPESHMYNAIESPVIAWPAGDYLGVRFLFDAYRHEDLSNDAPGMFYTWGIRSADTDAGDLISDAGYQDRNFVYYGGPDFIRGGEADATDLVVPGRDEVQVSLAVYELGYIWGWAGDDGYPAPYFDNVSLICYDYFGPGMAARELDLAQDAFPADGEIHTAPDLGLNDVRFDMANSISLATDLFNDAGDSVVIDIVAVRTGSALVETDVDATVTAPRLYFTVKMNTLFDSSMRLGVGPFTCDSEGTVVLNGQITDITGDIMTGYVQGAHAEANAVPSPDRWMFDLPDADFLYPGDVLHYYIEAWDNASGDYQNATMPADLAGYGDFSGPLAYNTSFVVHALPTMTDSAGAQPNMLFWNDFANRGGQNEWHSAFANLGFQPGEDYDIYYTNGPSSGVGNGLGRTALGQLYGYDVMVYTSGDLSAYTISNQDFESDPGDDVGVMSDWLGTGNKFLFATGDDLVSDMVVNGGTTTSAFVTSWMGLTFQSNDARPLLGGDTAPVVTAYTDVPTGDPVFTEATSWIAYGGCRGINTFDAVTVNGGERLAYFNSDASGLSAATLFTALNGSRVLTMPYDFMYIRTNPNAAKDPATLPDRVLVLKDVLAYSGIPAEIGEETPAGLPGAKFAASNHPNPFNPSTKISYTMPKAGHLMLKVYNVRGELVKTLIDDYVTESGHVMWDGTNDQGKSVSSGVYFYEARTDNDVVVNKMALVK